MKVMVTMTATRKCNHKLTDLIGRLTHNEADDWLQRPLQVRHPKRTRGSVRMRRSTDKSAESSSFFPLFFPMFCFFSLPIWKISWLTISQLHNSWCQRLEDIFPRRRQRLTKTGRGGTAGLMCFNRQMTAVEETGQEKKYIMRSQQMTKTILWSLGICEECVVLRQ